MRIRHCIRLYPGEWNLNEGFVINKEDNSSQEKDK